MVGDYSSNHLIEKETAPENWRKLKMVSISSFHFMNTHKKVMLGMWKFPGNSLGKTR